MKTFHTTKCKRMEQYIPKPLRCFKCQRYSYHREGCKGRQICERCSENDPDQNEEDYPNSPKWSKCHQNHSAFSRSCDINKSEG